MLTSATSIAREAGAVNSMLSRRVVSSGNATRPSPPIHAWTVRGPVRMVIFTGGLPRKESGNSTLIWENFRVSPRSIESVGWRSNGWAYQSVFSSPSMAERPRTAG